MNNYNNILSNLLNNSSAMQNPMFSNAVEMYRKGDTQGLQNLAQNLCSSRGITPQDVLRRLGLR